MTIKDGAPACRDGGLFMPPALTTSALLHLCRTDLAEPEGIGPAFVFAIHSGSPAFRRPSSYLARSPGRREGNRLGKRKGQIGAVVSRHGSGVKSPAGL